MFGISVDFDSNWAKLSDIVFKLIRCEAVSRERWNSSFEYVYLLCNSRSGSHAPVLYSSTTALITARVQEICEELLNQNDSELLPAYVHHWDTFHRGLMDLDNLYRCVNQQYVRNLRPTEADMCYSAILPMIERHTMEILEVGLANWNEHLIDLLKNRLSVCLVREVSNDRQGISAQQHYIPLVLDSFRRVGELRYTEKGGKEVYNRIFHEPLLDVTRVFYTCWATENEAACSFADYILRALALREEETQRAQNYFRPSANELSSLFQEIVVNERLSYLNQSVPEIVSSEQITSLRNLFLLLAPDNRCGYLADCFGQHIMQLIRTAIENLPPEITNTPVEFVESLLAIRTRFVQFIDEVFDGQALFRDQMDKAFNQAINTRSPVESKPALARPSELLSRYMDVLLRQSAKSSSYSELETKLTSSIAIFKYIDDKDVFQKFYQRMLCKRLISHNPSVMELEESVINQLKVVCGLDFTGKFQRMFNDIQLASELNKKFEDYLQSNCVQLRFGHHFNVLTQCSWPITVSGTLGFKIPDDIHYCMTRFEEFYASSYQGRKMRWAHNCSTIELLLLFTDKPYQLLMPTILATILLQFDETDSDIVPLAVLCDTLQLREMEDSNKATSEAECSTHNPSVLKTDGLKEKVEKLLSPLLEVGLLQLSTSSEGEQHVTLNRTFSNRRLKFKINIGAQTKESVQAEAEQVDRQANEDRRYFIQAAIVRIMKTRKHIDHATLLKMVLQHAGPRFQPSVSLIKQCVESLIEKGYIERNPDDPDHYNYLA